MDYNIEFVFKKGVKTVTYLVLYAPDIGLTSIILWFVEQKFGLGDFFFATINWLISWASGKKMVQKAEEIIWIRCQNVYFDIFEADSYLTGETGTVYAMHKYIFTKENLIRTHTHAHRHTMDWYLFAFARTQRYGESTAQRHYIHSYLQHEMEHGKLRRTHTLLNTALLSLRISIFVSGFRKSCTFMLCSM